MNLFVKISRLLGEVIHSALALMPEGELKNSLKYYDIWNWVMIWNTDITIKGLEAFLEASFQIQLQLYVYYNGYELGNCFLYIQDKI